MVQAIIFDLDDTLYEERFFFRGGFAAVGHELERRGVGSAAEVASLLENWHHAESRGGVFQKLAALLGFPEEWIAELVTLFRSHEPSIALCDDATVVLPRLRQHYRLGCVTDGWAHVQRRKIQALRIEEYVDAILVADDYGREYWKPHPRPLEECCGLLGVTPDQVLMVGDNPDRDMAAARSAGMRSVRLRRADGYFARSECAEVARADFEISDLYGLEKFLRL
jgi:putative hydrolase of the HAD superfamily